MPNQSLPDLAGALSSLRLALSWSQVDLGKAAGTGQINEYERGRKTLTRKRLEQLIAFMGLPPEAIDAALEFQADIRALAAPPRISADSVPRRRWEYNVPANKSWPSTTTDPESRRATAPRSAGPARGAPAPP